MTNTLVAGNAVSATRSQVGLWARLKRDTRTAHERLDGRIMEGNPFQSLERYGRFVMVQYDFHVLVSPLYQQDDLARLLPDLQARDRLAQIEQDLNDLGLNRPETTLRTPLDPRDMPNALGWLYAAEGSNLGAAYLLKAARKLDLSEDFGARHLAAAPGGRGLHWKTFTAAIDAIALSDAAQSRASAGASDAFTTVLQAVETRFFNSQG